MGKALAAHGKDYVLFYELRANLSPYELLCMEEGGLRYVQFGIESLSSSYLKRIGKGTTTIQPGDVFLAGEQVFRVDTTPRASDGNDPDGTQFYSSPKRPSPFRLVQILRGGITATQVCAREASVSVGREGCDMNFPNDPYMSTRHARVEQTPQGGFVLLDTGSKNGTYLSIRGERELNHGDYLFIGRELLRVDISA